MRRAGNIAEIESFIPVVMSEARRLSDDLFTREDLVQEGIIAALRALGTYDPDRGSIEGYVRTCARNRMISYLRRSWQELLLDEEAFDAQTSELDASAAADGGHQERIEIGEALTGLLNSLSSLEKSVLHAYLREGSVTDAAFFLKCERKKVDNALQRIRNKARGK
ncbi:MAG: sigma-70 family RNA polymerase sigma factor [Synergistaceae bacterium]|nr:sigma-70 family RNA polymerase sigma factor [Synergistaceae bacterium]